MTAPREELSPGARDLLDELRGLRLELADLRRELVATRGIVRDALQKLRGGINIGSVLTALGKLRGNG